MKQDVIVTIKKPRITEKAAVSAEKGSYVFEVSKDANKATIAQAIKALYKVTPVKVAIVKLPAKKVFVRGKKGRTNEIKKAYVYLKKGDKIDLA